MAFNVDILLREHLAIILYSSDVTKADFDGVWNSLVQSNFDWRFDEIAVFGPNADLASLNFESVNDEARRFKTTHEEVAIERNRRSAIVVSNQVQVLGARMFLAFIATNPPPHVEFKLFNKVSTAIAWVEEGRPENSKARRIDRAEVERSLAALDRARRLANGEVEAKVG